MEHNREAEKEQRVDLQHKLAEAVAARPFAAVAAAFCLLTFKGLLPAKVRAAYRREFAALVDGSIEPSELPELAARLLKSLETELGIAERESPGGAPR